MRHRLVVLAIVLAVSGVAGCSRHHGDSPGPQAQPAVPGSSTAPLPGASQPGAGLPGATLGPAGGVAGPGSTTSPGAVPGVTANPTDPAGAVKGRPQSLPTGDEINATGIGPYTIGQQAATLSSAKLIGPVTSGSAGCDRGTGAAKWGSPTLFLTKGKIQHVRITSAAVRTGAGIKVGSSEANVRTAYPKGSVTSGRAWYVPTGDFALLFRLAGGKVTAVEAGPASIMETGAAAC